jgi:hypothetical protein
MFSLVERLGAVCGDQISADTKSAGESAITRPDTNDESGA